MKQLCYFTIWREDSETIGINQKIRNQVKAFAKLGFESYFCVSASSEVKLYQFNLGEQQFELIDSKKFSPRADYASAKKGTYRKLSSLYRLNECLDFMNENQKKYGFEIIYIRRITPFTNRTGKMIDEWSKTGAKIVWEIPTWGEKAIGLRAKLLQSKERHMYAKHNKAMRIVAISSGQEGKEGKEGVLFINNGVANDSIPKKKITIHEGINLVCLATFSKWHGYDRLLNGMKEYLDQNNKEQVNIYMIGNGDTDELKEMANNLGIDRYVHFTGLKTGDDLNEIFDNMDVAIGNLGFFRTGVTTDTTIKIREYCARGIPFVTALKVNDFPSDYPYIMKVPMDESHINILSIVEFVKKQDLNHTSKEMRNYAEINLSWEKQLAKVIDAVK